MSKWKLSDKVFLRINYGKMPYKQMQKVGYMRDKSDKSISRMAVKLGLSRKRNYTREEQEYIQQFHPKEVAAMLGKTENAIKIKKSRLCNTIKSASTLHQPSAL